MADGLIYQNYKDGEVSKAVDIVIDELLPKLPEAAPNVVSAESLNNANNTINDLRAQLSAVSSQSTDLNNQINNLKAQAESDRNSKQSTEQENDIVINQLDALSKVLNQLTDQLSVALQKSIDESVMRTSLHAANQGYKAQIEAYIKQIDTLNNLIFGLQAQLGAVQEQRVLDQNNFQQQLLLAQQQLVQSQQNLTSAELQLLELQAQQAALLAAGGTTSTTTNTTTTSTTTTGTTTAGTTTSATTTPPGELIGGIAYVSLGTNNYPTKPPIYARFQGSQPNGTWNTWYGALPNAKWGNGQTVKVTNSDSKAITVQVVATYNGYNNFLAKIPQWYTASPALATLQPGETKIFNLTLNWSETRGMDSRQNATSWSGTKAYFDNDLVVRITNSAGIPYFKLYPTSYEVIHPSSWT